MLRRIATLLAIAGTVTLVIGTAQPLLAQAQDPLVGQWSMNAAKSTSTGPMPRSRDLVITQKGAEMTVVVHEVSADGTDLKWSFTTKRDGKPVPVTGWSAIDTAVTTLNGSKGKTTYSKAGKSVMESNTSVAADGKTLVITGTRTGPDGKVVTFSSHYDRK